MKPLPLLLKLVMLGLALSVGVMLVFEVFVWRPGYAFGDESLFISTFHEPLYFRWTQGSLYRLLMKGWVGLAGARMGVLHLPGLLILAAEAALLYAVARRWAGEEAAAWAVMMDLLASGTWLRARGLLSHQLLPFWALLFCWLATKVQGRRSAMIWGASAALLALDYEGSLITLPLAFLACMAHEPSFRKQGLWAAGAGAMALAGVLWAQADVVNQYVGLRMSISVGERLLAYGGAIASNLHGLVVGGTPLPYLAVDDWPAQPFWVWPGLGLGLLVAWRTGHRSLLVWAVLAVLATQMSLAPYGVPSHRLVAAMPALCILGGLGLTQFRQGLGRWGSAAAVGLLVAGAAVEAHGFALHMLRHGPATYDRSLAFDMALDEALEESDRTGASVSFGLADWHIPVGRFHLRGRDLKAPKAGAGALVLVDPHFRRALEALPVDVKVFLLAKGQQPLLLLRARGPLAERFRAIDDDLAEALNPASAPPAEKRRRIEAWMRAHPQADPLVWACLAHVDIRLSWLGAGALGVDQWQLLMQRPMASPGPYAKLAEYYSKRDPETSLRLALKALEVDPAYGPAWAQKAAALDALGRSAEADDARAQWDRLFDQGAWFMEG